MEVFELSKGFPAEEKFALTSQIRRSSRSVCLNLREAWLRPVGDVFKEKRIKPRLFVGRYLNEFSSLRDQELLHWPDLYWPNCGSLREG
jgi:23S rRNA-intervening sequence protein